MNEGYRWKKKLFSEQGRAQLEKLASNWQGLSGGMRTDFATHLRKPC
jgi:hypothetical protein